MPSYPFRSRTRRAVGPAPTPEQRRRWGVRLATAMMWEDRGDAARALQVYEEGVREGCDVALLYLRLARMHARAGRSRDERRVWRAALRHVDGSARWLTADVRLRRINRRLWRRRAALAAVLAALAAGALYAPLPLP